MQTTGGSICVLFVDDEPVFRKTAADVIEQKNDRITVETATNADEGLDRIADSCFDCIVSDYEMPKQTGIEFLEIIRERYPGLPFILFTGKGNERVASDAISVGVTDYLRKRGNIEQYDILANRIESVVEQSRSRGRTTKQERDPSSVEGTNAPEAYKEKRSSQNVRRVNELLETLSDPVRREIVHYFENHAERTDASLDEVISHIVARKPGESHEKLMLELPQTHLAKLQSKGWLDYDSRTGHIAYHGNEGAKQLLSDVFEIFSE